MAKSIRINSSVFVPILASVLCIIIMYGILYPLFDKRSESHLKRGDLKRGSANTIEQFNYVKNYETIYKDLQKLNTTPSQQDELKDSEMNIDTYLAKYNPGAAFPRTACLSRRPEFVKRFDTFLKDNVYDMYYKFSNYAQIDNTFKQFPSSSPLLKAAPELKDMKLGDNDLCLQYAFIRLNEFKPPPDKPKPKPEFQTMWRYLFDGPSIYETDYGDKNSARLALKSYENTTGIESESQQLESK